jgi:hypothetical protein
MKRAVTPTLFAEQSANLAFREIAGLIREAAGAQMGGPRLCSVAVRAGPMTAPGTRMAPQRGPIQAPAPPGGAPVRPPLPCLSKFSTCYAVHSRLTNIHTITKGRTDMAVARNPDDEE